MMMTTKQIGRDPLNLRSIVDGLNKQVGEESSARQPVLASVLLALVSEISCCDENGAQQ
jgi:hypothetical protein